MKQSSNLSDFIFIEKSIPDTICAYVLEELESNHWEKHQWGSIYGDAVEETETSKEPDITYSKPLDSILNSFLYKQEKDTRKNILTNLIPTQLILSFHFLKLDSIVITLIKKWICILIILKVYLMVVIPDPCTFFCWRLSTMTMKEVN